MKKKLYRNLEDRWLGGICSGIAIYMDWDVSLIRVACIILSLVSFFITIPAYFAAWIIIPGAKTEEDKKRMRGNFNK